MPKTHLEFKQFKAWVEIGGEPTPCYAVDVDKEEKHVSCWIASEEGKAFKLGFDKHRPTPWGCAVVFNADRTEFAEHYYKRGQLGERREGFISVSDTQEQPLVFSSINVVGDDESSGLPISTSPPQTEGVLGGLTVTVQRLSSLRVRRVRPGTAARSEPYVLDIEKIPESSKLALTMPHQVGLGEVRRKFWTTGPSGLEWNIGEVMETIVKFTFRYRSLDLLQRCGIVAPIELDLGDEDDDDEEEEEEELAMPVIGAQDTPVVTPEAETAPPAMDADVTPGDTNVQVRVEEEDDTSCSQLLGPDLASGEPPVKADPNLEYIKEEDIKEEEDVLDEELEQQAQALRAQLDKIEALKQKRKQTGPGEELPRKRIKIELEGIDHTRYFMPKEVIDLTID